MGALMDALGRSSGELIRSVDWNSLVAAVEKIESDLTSRIDAEVATITGRLDGLDTDVGDLAQRAGQLEENIAGVQEEVEDAAKRIEQIRTRFRGVTLHTDRLQFAIGEQSTIVAQITDISGEALTFGSGATRPWVDFVTAWGQLKPAPGFTSVGGAGDRTISVQVNANGVARVLLRAEHAEGFTEEAEAEVSAALTTTIAAAQRTIGQAILTSNTPLEARENGAFTLLTREYERTDARSLQQYVDAYYLKNPSILGGKIVGNFFHRWRDYRSTVMAFAKSDGDPRTADPSLGACSIQVTFRDWISPWIHLDFMDKPQLKEELAIDLGRVITPDIEESNRAVRDRIRDLTGNQGLIGRQRTYESLIGAMDLVETANPPRFMEDFRANVKNGIRVQQGLEYGQNVGIGAGTGSAALDAFSHAATMSQHMTAGIEQTVGAQVQQAIAQAEQQISQTVNAAQSEFVDDFFSSSGAFMTMRNEVETLKGNVDGVRVDLGKKANEDFVSRLLEMR